MVVVLNERGHCLPDLCDGAEGVAIDGLLFQSQDEPLRDSVGLGLGNEGEAVGDAPVADLANEVIRRVLGPWSMRSSRLRAMSLATDP